jgi:hypothetical protein
MKAATFLLAAGLVLTAPSSSRAGTPADSSGTRRLRLLLDCSAFICDFDYLKRELNWVDWVRDRVDADVYVLVTMQDTGSGGAEAKFYVMRPRGGGPAADTLRVFAPATASEDDSRRLISRTLQAALARDLVGRPEGDRLSITVAAPANEAVTPAGTDRDPWNHWVYKIGMNGYVNGYVNGEASYRDYYLYSSITAYRVTERAKLGAIMSQNYSEKRHRVGEGSRYTTIRGWSTRALLVWTLGPRWSAGVSSNVYASTYSNIDWSAWVGPALEFDVYPYEESSRRAITLGYQVQAGRNDYLEITLYGKTAETLFSHALDLSLSQNQPWGSPNVGTSASQYLHDASKYRLSAFASADLKLFKGFSLNGYTNGSYIRNQLTLRRGHASESEILARRHQFATNWQYHASFGISCRFGSIFDSVVNPRLDNTFGGL